MFSNCSHAFIQRISLGITKEDARAIHGETAERKADLTRLVGAVGARL